MEKISAFFLTDNLKDNQQFALVLPGRQVGQKFGLRSYHRYSVCGFRRLVAAASLVDADVSVNCCLYTKKGLLH